MFLDFGSLEAVSRRFFSVTQVVLLAWKGYLLVPRCLKTAPCVLTGLLKVALLFRHSV